MLDMPVWNSLVLTGTATWPPNYPTLPINLTHQSDLWIFHCPLFFHMNRVVAMEKG